jgi:eukaryotic-like serine/threonine-protein kinase
MDGGRMAGQGETIGGYRIRNILQSGQVSQVYEVVEPQSNRHFAMKILLQEKAGDKDLRAAIFHEAAVGIKLKHDNIIRIHKVSKDKATPHFIMDFFPSGSLRGRVLQKDTNFLKEHMEKIFKQSSLALAYMHGNGWVHCDVKPDNMLVNQLGELRMIDFAITKQKKSGFFAKLMHKRKKPQGTPSFMAPEQIKDDLLDGRADIYSLGATFYELLTLRPPFRAGSMNDLLMKHLREKPDPPTIYNPEISDDMSDLILKMLAKKREDRPENCHQIMMRLRDIRIFRPQKR